MRKDSPPAIKVLLVDDNLHGLTARRLILEEQGFDVQTALSGEEAWEIFNRAPFDIVVTDYRMGPMNGIDLIGLIRASDSPARTILLSAFVECLGMTERSTGADHVISKSGREVQELLRALRRMATAQPHRRGPKAQPSARTLACGAKGLGTGGAG